MIVAALVSVATATGAPALDLDRAHGVRDRLNAPLEPAALALARLRVDSLTPVEGRLVNGFPRALFATVPVPGATPDERAEAFLTRYADLFGIPPHGEGGGAARLKPVVTGVSDDGGIVSLYQTWRGIPVMGAGMMILVDGDQVTGAFGRMLTARDMRRALLDPLPVLSARAAVTKARNKLNLWGRDVLGTPMLVIYDPSLHDDGETKTPAPKLAWRIRFDEAGGTDVVLNAKSGGVLRVLGHAMDAYRLDLFDAYGQSIESLGCFWFQHSVDLVAEASYILPDYWGDEEVEGAHADAKSAYTFYKGRFGIDSFDSDGTRFRVAVYDTTPGLARYNPGCLDFMEFNEGATTYDVMIHELTHAVQQRMSNPWWGPLEYEKQSGALNESFSDVMAAIATFTWTNVVGRNLCDPPKSQQPDHVDSFWYHKGAGDHYGVHTNSGIPNKVGCLLAKGGLHRGRNVAALGSNPGGKLYERLGWLQYAAMTSLWPTSNFNDARDGEVAIASKWAKNGSHGFKAADVCSVRNAWASVGVGSGDADCDGTGDSKVSDADGDLVPDDSDDCPYVSNPVQGNSDSDGYGDACDPDDDNDSIPDGADNCPFTSNFTQSNADFDKWGDACDPEDPDKDLVEDKDNCPTIYNPNQSNIDGDGLGDACDPDKDNDGVPNGIDNCAATYNPAQKDTDKGGIGDACDPTPNDPIDDYSATGSAFLNIKLQRLNGLDRLVIDPCTLGCDHWLMNPIQVSLTGLEDTTVVWISDALGNTITEPTLSGRATYTAQFTPRIGMSYTLTMALDPRTEVSTDSFTLSIFEPPD